MKTPAEPPEKQPPDVPDPYGGSDRYTIPMALSVEHDSETVWQDFKAAEEKLDTQFAKTDFVELEEKIAPQFAKTDLIEITEQIDTQFAKTDFIEIQGKG
jgi:hypothetical protein